MFTGIIQARGRVTKTDTLRGDRRLTIDCGALGLSAVQLGDSVAVSGVCLTVVGLEAACLLADVSNETLGLTTLGSIAVGDSVNLELALRLQDRLGGHLVSGHVDGMGCYQGKVADGRSWRMSFAMPAKLAKYVAVKGSICIDGVSLTVNRVDASTFSVNIVPHTMDNTTLGQYKDGDQVNLEVDLLARYVERMLQQGDAGQLTESTLIGAGFHE